jgi:hypothetical protein
MPRPNNVEHVIVLESIDGFEYCLAVIPPKGDTINEAVAKAEKAIEDAHAAAPGEWTFEEHMLPALEAAGFIVPSTIHGPEWDNG